MDYEVLLRAVTSDEDIYFCQSSDDLMFCKVSPQSYFGNSGIGPAFTMDVMANFVISNTNIRHKIFMGNPIRYLACDDEKAFKLAEKEAQRFVDAVYKLAELRLAKVPPSETKMMVYAKSFLGPIENFISPQIQSQLKDIIPN